jgi:hypothetical protein
MHGAGGGAPTGKGNGNYRHGERTAKARSERRALRALLRGTRDTLARLDGDS